MSLKDSDLHQAWDLYYHVFKRINKQLPSLVQLELQYVAPALIRAQVNPSSYPLPPLAPGFAKGSSRGVRNKGSAGERWSPFPPS